MPAVEKVRGGRVHVRGIGAFELGDRADVSEDQAAYLLEERSDFALVDEGTSTQAESDASAAAGDGAEDGSADDDDEQGAATCGYFDPETMDSPCGRVAGWGRDADDGPCKDHVELVEGA